MRARAASLATWVAALALHSCSKDAPAGEALDGGAEMVADASAREATLAPCLDRPTDLPRPPAPSGQLPCELLPPGFGSEKR